MLALKTVSANITKFTETFYSKQAHTHACKQPTVAGILYPPSPPDLDTGVGALLGANRCNNSLTVTVVIR